MDADSRYDRYVLVQADITEPWKAGKDGFFAIFVGPAQNPLVGPYLRIRPALVKMAVRLIGPLF
jgi:hypothetical protein